MKQLMIPVVALGLALGGWSSAQASLVSIDAAMAATQDATQAAVSGHLLIADAAALTAPASTLAVAGTDVQAASGLQLCNRRDKILRDTIAYDHIVVGRPAKEEEIHYLVKRDRIEVERIQRDRILSDQPARERIQIDP